MNLQDYSTNVQSTIRGIIKITGCTPNLYNLNHNIQFGGADDKTAYCELCRRVWPPGTGMIATAFRLTNGDILPIPKRADFPAIFGGPTEGPAE